MVEGHAEKVSVYVTILTEPTTWLLVEYEAKCENEEEKCKLKKAYEEGLVNTKLDKQPQIEQLAKKLKRSETEIKVC